MANRMIELDVSNLADGGIWKNEAISNVRKYLEVAFKEEIEANQINIIA